MPRVMLGSVENLSSATVPIDVTDIARQTDAAAPRIVLLAVTDKNGSVVFHVCSAVCPHDGCHVLYGGHWGTSPEPEFDDETKVVTCPCHGSRFNLSDGSLVTGPAQKALNYYPTVVEDGSVYVEL